MEGGELSRKMIRKVDVGRLVGFVTVIYWLGVSNCSNLRRMFENV